MNEAFEVIVERYEPLIRKFLIKYHLLKNYQEMHQVGLIALWEAWNKHDPIKGPFPAYASATIKGRLLTEIKRQKRYSDYHYFTEDLPESMYSPRTEERALDINQLLNFSVLSQRERLWVYEAVLLGKETKNIAEEQGVTADTVRSWKKAALKKFRSHIQTQ